MPRVEIDFEGEALDAVAAIEQVDRSLDKLDRKKVEVPVDVNTSSAEAKLAALERHMNSIDERTIRIAARDAAGRYTGGGQYSLAGDSAMRDLLIARAVPRLRGGTSSSSFLDEVGREILRSATPGGISGGGGGGGGGRRRGGGGFFSWGENDASPQAGDIFRGILPGGTRQSTGSLTTLASGALGLGAAAAPGIGGLGLAGAGFGLGAVTTVTALAVAMRGLGDAIDGNYKAYEKLGPEQRQFVDDVRSFIPYMDKLRDIVGEGFYGGAAEGLNSLFSPTFMKNLESGFSTIGDTLGDVARGWGEFLGSTDQADKFGRFLENSAGWTQDFSDAMMSLFDAVTTMIDAGSPFIDWVSEGIAKGAEWVNVWTDAKVQSGEFAGFLDQAKESIRAFGGFIGDALSFLTDFGSVLDGPVLHALELLGNGLRTLGDTIEDNQDTIEAFVTGAIDALAWAVEQAWPAVKNLAEALNDAADAVGGWENAFKIIIGGILITQVLKLKDAFTGLMGAQGVGGLIGAATAAETLSGKLGALSRLAPIAITVAFVAKQMSDEATEWLRDKLDPNGAMPDEFWSADAALGYDQKGKTPNTKDFNPPGPFGRIAGWTYDASMDLLRKAGLAPEETPTAMGPFLSEKGTAPALPNNVPYVDTLGGKGTVDPAAALGGTHSTANNPPFQMGAAGFLGGSDQMKDAGTLVIAPEDGQITRLSGLDPTKGYAGKAGGGAWGLSIYFVGQSGKVYYLTHLSHVRPEGAYRKGEPIGIVGNYGGANAHLHTGIGSGSQAMAVALSPSSAQANWTTGLRAGKDGKSPAAGEAPGFDKGLPTGADLLNQKQRDMLNAALRSPAEGDDLRTYRTLIAQLTARRKGMKSGELRDNVDDLITDLSQRRNAITSSRTTPSGDDLLTRGEREKLNAARRTSNVDRDDIEILTAITKRLAAKMKQTPPGELRDNIDDLLTTLDGELDRATESRDAKRKRAREEAAKKLEDELERTAKRLAKQGDALRDKAADMVDAVLERQERRVRRFQDAVRESTRAALAAFDQATSEWQSPSRMLAEKEQEEKTDADLQKQLEDAEKALDDARKGVSDRGKSDSIVEDAKKLLGQYTLANEIDKVQSAILGGEHVSQFGDQFAEEMRKVLSGRGALGGIDEEAIKDAEERVADIRFTIRQRGLEKAARAEEEDWKTRRAKERQKLEESLADWEAYYQRRVKLYGMNPERAATTAAVIGGLDAMDRGAAINVSKVDTALAANPYLFSGGTAAAPGGKLVDERLQQYKLEQAEAKLDGLGFFAEGGIADKPTLGVFGERGREALIPLDDPRSKRMLGGGSTTVQVNVADGMGWLEQFIQVQVEDAADSVGNMVGATADRYRREGRT